MIKSGTQILLELALCLNASGTIKRPDYPVYFCMQCAVALNLDCCVLLRKDTEENHRPGVLISWPPTANLNNLDLNNLRVGNAITGEIGVMQPIDKTIHTFDAGSLGRVVMVGHIEQDQQFADNFARLICQISDAHLILLKNAELIEENKRLTLATKAGGIGTWELNTHTEELRWDDQMFYLFEVDKNSFDGKYDSFKKHLHPDDAGRLLALFDNYLALTHTGPIDYQFRIVTPTGQIKKIAGSANRENYPGSVPHLIGINYDITEIEIARTQSIYRSQLENLLIDLSMKVIRSGPEEIDNVTNIALEAVGKFVGADRAYRFIYDFDADVCYNTHEWCNHGIEPEIDNLQGISTRDMDLWVSSHKRGLPMYIAHVLDLPVGDSSREILEPQGIKSLITIPLMEADHCSGFIGFDSVKHDRHWNEIDVSLLKLLAELLINAELKARNEVTIQKTQQALIDSRDTARYLAKEAATANLAKSRFIASVSHEIRTPLHAILGIADLILNQAMDVNLIENINIIKSSGSTLLELINDVLTFASAEAKDLSIKSDSFNIYHLSDYLKKIFTSMADRKNLIFDINIQSPVPEILIGDKLRIQQILSNLIANAIKFTDHGGVTLNIALEKNWPEMEAKTSVAHIRFEVIDTGIGISDNDIVKLFDPFFQSEEIANNLTEGAGLGLAICHLLSTKMGGSLTVESVKGRGSKFIFAIALGADFQQHFREIPSGEAPDEFDLSGIRILLAEDNPLNQSLMRAFLQKTGCELDIVANGREALDAFENAHYDIILMDVRMPVLDGFDTTKLIRSQERPHQHIPIVAVTASALKNDRETCLQAGMDSVLTKPFSKRELLKAIQHWIPNGAS